MQKQKRVLEIEEKKSVRTNSHRVLSNTLASVNEKGGKEEWSSGLQEKRG